MEFFFGFGGWGKKLKKRGKYFSKDYYSSQIKVLADAELFSNKKSIDNYQSGKSTHNRLVVASSPTGPTIHLIRNYLNPLKLSLHTYLKQVSPDQMSLYQYGLFRN